MQTLARRGVGDAAAGLGLHFLHMSEGPFSHDAGHMMEKKTIEALPDKVRCLPTCLDRHLVLFEESAGVFPCFYRLVTKFNEDH